MLTLPVSEMAVCVRPAKPAGAQFDGGLLWSDDELWLEDLAREGLP